MTSLFEDAIGIRAIEQEFSVLNNTEYYIYNSATGEIIRLCNYDDSDCTAALQQQGYYMLSPETYGEDAYSYPAIYTSPGIVWDQSAERNSNGDWTMYSDSNPHPTPQPTPDIDNTEYYIYNSATGEIIRLCNYDDSDCTAALQQQGYYLSLIHI